jgi:hypothetical protein
MFDISIYCTNYINLQSFVIYHKLGKNKLNNYITNNIMKLKLALFSVAFALLIFNIILAYEILFITIIQH